MGIISGMFNWITGRDSKGKEVSAGYILEQEPRTVKEIRKVFKAFKLEKYLPAVEPLLRPAIGLQLERIDEADIEDTDSKIGGKPSLKADQQWPVNSAGKSMSFIGQLNLEEVSEFDQSDRLPKEGFLSFFYCAD